MSNKTPSITNLQCYLSHFGVNVWPYVVPIWISFLTWYKEKYKVEDDSLLLASCLVILNNEVRYPPLEITKFVSEKFGISNDQMKKSVQKIRKAFYTRYINGLPKYHIQHEGKKHTVPIYYWFNSTNFRAVLDVRNKSHFIRVIDCNGNQINTPESNQHYRTKLVYVPQTEVLLTEDNEDETHPLL